MYGPPRLCKAFVPDDIDSLLKCIRPLASELRLQPGHDEIRALRSHILSAGTRPCFPEGLTKRRSTVSSSFLEPRKLDLNRLHGADGARLVDRSRSIHDNPCGTCNLRGERYDDFVHVHSPFELLYPFAEPVFRAI